MYMRSTNGSLQPHADGTIPTLQTSVDEMQQPHDALPNVVVGPQVPPSSNAMINLPSNYAGTHYYVPVGTQIVSSQASYGQVVAANGITYQPLVAAFNPVQINQVPVQSNGVPEAQIYCDNNGYGFTGYPVAVANGVYQNSLWLTAGPQYPGNVRLRQWDRSRRRDGNVRRIYNRPAHRRVLQPQYYRQQHQPQEEEQNGYQGNVEEELQQERQISENVAATAQMVGVPVKATAMLNKKMAVEKQQKEETNADSAANEAICVVIIGGRTNCGATEVLVKVADNRERVWATVEIGASGNGTDKCKASGVGVRGNGNSASTKIEVVTDGSVEMNDTEVAVDGKNSWEHLNKNATFASIVFRSSPSGVAIKGVADGLPPPPPPPKAVMKKAASVEKMTKQKNENGQASKGCTFSSVVFAKLQTSKAATDAKDNNNNNKQTNDSARASGVGKKATNAKRTIGGTNKGLRWLPGTQSPLLPSKRVADGSGGGEQLPVVAEKKASTKVVDNAKASDNKGDLANGGDGKDVAGEAGLVLRLGEIISTNAFPDKSNLVPIGFENAGNMCYVNAVMQAVLACGPFYNLLNELSNSHVPDNGRFRWLQACVKAVSSLPVLPRSSCDFDRMVKNRGRKSVALTELHDLAAHVLSAVPRNSNHQEDAQEFLCRMLNGLNDELLICLAAYKSAESKTSIIDQNFEDREQASTTGIGEWQVVGSKKKAQSVRRNEPAHSPLMKIFYGAFRSTMSHPGTRDSVNIENFLTVPLEVQNDTVCDLSSALKVLFTKETIAKHQKNGKPVYCDKMLTFEALPKFLIFHLKYFMYSRDKVKKIVKPFTLQDELHIRPEYMSKEALQQWPEERRMYQLRAVVYHHGYQADRGHYTCLIEHEGKWFHANDANLSLLDSMNVKGNSGKVPYLLFYGMSKKKNTC